MYKLEVRECKFNDKTDYNWLNYNLYCYKTGLNPGDYKIFKNWIEKGVCIKND